MTCVSSVKANAPDCQHHARFESVMGGSSRMSLETDTKVYESGKTYVFQHDVKKFNSSRLAKVFAKMVGYE